MEFKTLCQTIHCAHADQVHLVKIMAQGYPQIFLPGQGCDSKTLILILIEG